MVVAFDLWLIFCCGMCGFDGGGGGGGGGDGFWSNFCLSEKESLKY